MRSFPWKNISYTHFPEKRRKVFFIKLENGVRALRRFRRCFRVHKRKGKERKGREGNGRGRAMYVYGIFHEHRRKTISTKCEEEMEKQRLSKEQTRKRVLLKKEIDKISEDLRGNLIILKSFILKAC